MKTPITCMGTAALVLLVAAAQTARADGFTNAGQARKYCQTQQGADTPQKLAACCGEYILSDPPARQRRLEQECATGVKQEPSDEEKAFVEKEKARREAERAARQEREASGQPMKASKQRAGGATPMLSSEPAAPNAVATTPATRPSPDCTASQGQQALSQLSDLARRLGGHKVPAMPDCPSQSARDKGG